MTSTGVQSKNWAKLLEPGLRKISLDGFKEKKPQFSQYLHILTSKKAVETDMRMGGFSEWNTKGSKDSTEYEDPTDTDIVMYKHTTFSKGFIMEKEMVDDEQYGQMKKFAANLGRTARHTLESRTIEILNNAFTALPNNYKGEALVSAAHKRLDGGTTTNYIGTLALSEPNLEVAFKLAREQVDERGLKIQMLPNLLIVPPSLEFTAEKILKSIQLPGTDLNDINPMRGRLKPLVLDWLEDDGRWFLVDTDIHQLNFFWRERLNFKTASDFDTDQAKYKGRMRFSYGWTDHRGVIGANPAAAQG